MTERTRRQRRGPTEVLVEMARLKGLSDSVVAFALTLLVLDIRIPPDVQADGLASAIGQLAPQFAIYLLGFVLIGGSWGSHQRMLGQIERGDGLMVWWTLLSLLPVTLVPACAVLLGDYPTAPVALTVFALDVIAIQLTSALLWRHASRHRLIEPGLDPRVVRSIGRRLLVVAGCFAVSIPLAFVWPPLTYAVWIATFALIFTTDWVSWRQSRRTSIVDIPVEGARRARLSISCVGGLLDVAPGDDHEALVKGSFGGGVEHRTTRTEDAVDVRLALPPPSPILNPRFPWAWGLVLECEIELNQGIPIDLDIDLSAGRGNLDLEHLRIERLELACPGGMAELTLPASAGWTTVELRSNGGFVEMRIPNGVAATFSTVGEGGSVEIDTAQFPERDGVHRSPDYDTAANRVEVRARLAAGSLTVRS